LGWYFAYALRNGKDITLPFSGFANWFMNLFQRKNKFKVSYSGKKVSDQEYNHNKQENQKAMDEILDKISKSGYNSLSKAEKDFLFRASKK
jgi:predicted glycosyltransferase involved in capsule biosynthesis